MSEYQCYEFVALEKPLTEKQMDELRSISSRAEITPTRFWNEYNWGDFRGDAEKLMASYFDAHLYFANWGTRRLMLRLSSSLVATKDLRPYFVGGAARVSGANKQIILDVHLDEGGADFYAETDDALLSALAPLRSELVCGDNRPAYLAWLVALQAGDVDERGNEPPVPPGLSDLTPAQRAMADFFGIDPDLLSAASAASAPIPDDNAAAERWLRALPAKSKDEWLTRALRDPLLQLGPALLGAFRQQAEPPAARNSRPVAELLSAADSQRAERERRASNRRAQPAPPAAKRKR